LVRPYAGVWDGDSKLEEAELSASGGAAVYMPEARTDVRSEVGAGPGGRLAGQLEHETRLLRVKLLRKSVEFWPYLYVWNRARWIDEEAGLQLTPAVGLVSSHVPILAGSVDFGFSARSELLDGDLPRSEVLVQLGISGGEHLLGGGPGIETLPGGSRANRDAGQSAAWRGFLG
jgi:hypothetical protein